MNVNVENIKAQLEDFDKFVKELRQLSLDDFSPEFDETDYVRDGVEGLMGTVYGLEESLSEALFSCETILEGVK